MTNELYNAIISNHRYRFLTYAVAAGFLTPLAVLMDMRGVSDTTILGLIVVMLPLIAIGTYALGLRKMTPSPSKDNRRTVLQPLSVHSPVAIVEPNIQNMPRIRVPFSARLLILYSSLTHRSGSSQNSDLFIQANQLLAIGQAEKALGYYQAAVRTGKAGIGTWHNMGVALQQLSRYQEALDCFDKALKINPFDEEVCAHRGLALFALGRYDEALAIYDRATTIAPHNGAMWFNKGQVLMLGVMDFKAALSCYEKAIELGSKEARITADACRPLIAMIEAAPPEELPLIMESLRQQIQGSGTVENSEATEARTGEG